MHLRLIYGIKTYLHTYLYELPNRTFRVFSKRTGSNRIGKRGRLYSLIDSSCIEHDLLSVSVIFIYMIYISIFSVLVACRVCVDGEPSVSGETKAKVTETTTTDNDNTLD